MRWPPKPTTDTPRETSSETRGVGWRSSGTCSLATAPHALVASKHPRPDVRYGIALAELRHCAGHQLSDGAGDARLVVWIDDPPVNATDDLVRLPSRRCRLLHGHNTFATGIVPTIGPPRSTRLKFALITASFCIPGGS
jgi:hypothetical protein